jgi:DNA gyrase subunit A
MVVADANATLLTACEHGYGKRTMFGDGQSEEDESSVSRYRTQKRGGKGVRDIKTTKRNGKVIGVVPVTDSDEILLMTSRGKLQRIACSDIRPIGRNTQGVRIMSLDAEDTLAAVVRVPRDAE